MTRLDASQGGTLNQGTARVLANIMDNANCKGVDGDYFFDDGTGRLTEAIVSNLKHGATYCSNCTVWQQCRQFALDNEQWGLWGGMLFTVTGVPRRDFLSTRKWDAWAFQ